jgi:hypothetical protein
MISLFLITRDSCSEHNDFMVFVNRILGISLPSSSSSWLPFDRILGGIEHDFLDRQLAFRSQTPQPLVRQWELPVGCLCHI